MAGRGRVQGVRVVLEAGPRGGPGVVLPERPRRGAGSEPAGQGGPVGPAGTPVREAAESVSGLPSASAGCPAPRTRCRRDRLRPSWPLVARAQQDAAAEGGVAGARYVTVAVGRATVIGG